MLEKLKTLLQKDFSFIENKKVLLTISGGVDSVVLVHLFHQLNYEVFLGHCNFQLRGEESDLDEEFVRKLGEDLNIKTFVVKFDTSKYAQDKKESTQIAARNLRYDWFEKITIENSIDYIATAHHLDDNLETFLINFSRGMGLDGLTGIPKKNRNIIRPLLSFSRKQILEYATQNGIDWREDESNKETKYKRNKIRHKIVPVLKEINPSILEGFAKMISYLEQSKEVINDKIEEITPKIITDEGKLKKIKINELLKLSNTRAYLYFLLKQYNFTEWENVYDLLTSQTGKTIHSKTHSLLKNRDFLILRELRAEPLENIRYEVGLGTVKLNEEISICIEKTDKNRVQFKNCILVNKNLVTFPMVMRKWEEGDFFYPTGMLGRKKISKFFKDEKLSKFEKQETWLLCNNNNEVIWVVGMRQDRRFSITPKINRDSILKISI